MTLTYSLSEDDFLNSQLFIIKSKGTFQKFRQISMITITVLYIITVSFSFYFKKDFFGYTMILIGLITLIAFPTYYKQSYKERLRTQLRDYVSNKFDIEFTIVLTDDYLRSISEDGETQLKLRQIGEIVEVGEYFYLKLKIGDTLIIPKNPVENIQDLQSELKQIAQRFEIGYTTDLNWRW